MAQNGAQVYDYPTAAPPAPPPKPSSGTHTPSHGPPLPPPPPSQADAAAFGHMQTPGSIQAQPIQGPAAGWVPAILLDKSTQDLHQLLESPDLQASLLDNAATSHPSIAQAQAPLRQLLETNIAASQSLLQMEQHLQELRSSTQTRLLALRALEQQHRNKISETENELSGFSPMALYQRLNASAQEQESLIKGIEESFLEEGGMASDKEVQDFVRRLRETKKSAYLRNERKMRWDEGRVGGWR